MRRISRLTEIRVATAGDDDAITKVHEAAFPSDAEARLVRMLEADGEAAVSLVAEDGDDVIGHVLLSRMRAHADGAELDALALAPVAVIPERQSEGVGGALVKAAEAAARQLKTQIIFLLGEPEYYKRFGYSVAAARPYASPYAGDYWQALVIDDGLIWTSAGEAAHAPAFAKLG